MTQTLINYIGNPVIHFFHSLAKSLEVSGMTRTARDLESMGYHNEAQEIYRRIQNEMQQR